MSGLAAITELNAYAISTPPGGIYTVDDENSTADCMLVENGIITAVGSVRPQLLERSSSQRVVGGVPDTAILDHSSRLSRCPWPYPRLGR